MRARSRYRGAVGVLAAASVAAASLWAAGPTVVDGVLLDALISARALVAPVREAPESSPVAVIALDQRSLESPELRAAPRTLMAPQWATILDAAFRAGARAVGFDIIFAFSG